MAVKKPATSPKKPKRATTAGVKTPAAQAPATASAAGHTGNGRLDGKLVTVFGGGGFVGRATAQALMRAGARVRIAQRHPRRAMSVRALGNLGQTQFVAADVTRPETLALAVHGSDMVVNLVGSFDRMDEVQAKGASAVAEAAARAGVQAMVHVSAIGADSTSPSLYGRSKAAGEAGVRAAMPAATILRPSIIFGRDDNFINRFARMIGLAPVVPVVSGNTRFQPVFVGDVADAIVSALANSATHAGRTYALGGPRQLSMRELMQWIGAEIRRKRIFVDVPDIAAAALANATGWLPGAPLTRDQWAMLARDNIVEPGEAGLAELGVAPTPLEAVAPGWLTLYRRAGRFAPRFAD